MADPAVGGAYDPNRTYTGTGGDSGQTFTNATLTGTTTVDSGATLTSPTLVTPTIGVATATSVNKVAITAPATSATLVIADGKTFTVNQTLTLTGTTGTTMTFPATSATIARTDAANTFTGVQTMTSPVLVTPALGVATATSLTAAGLVKSSTATGGVGYATGAGLTATQSTDKSTTVANAASAPSLCGAITMNNAALNAGVIVSFTFTNSAIAATDVMILNHISGGTVGSYTLNAQCGAGSAVINVRNNTAGNLSDAIVIQYAVIKGVNA